MEHDTFWTFSADTLRASSMEQVAKFAENTMAVAPPPLNDADKAAREAFEALATSIRTILALQTGE